MKRSGKSKDIFEDSGAVALAVTIKEKVKSFKSFGFYGSPENLFTTVGYAAVGLGLLKLAQDNGLATITIGNTSLGGASYTEIENLAFLGGIYFSGASAIVSCSKSMFDRVSAWFSNQTDKKSIYNDSVEYLKTYGINVNKDNPIVWTNGKVYLVREGNEPFLRSVNKSSFLKFINDHTNAYEALISVSNKDGEIVYEQTKRGELLSSNERASRVIVTKDLLSGEPIIKQEWYEHGYKFKENVMDKNLKIIEGSEKKFEMEESKTDIILGALLRV